MTSSPPSTTTSSLDTINVNNEWSKFELTLSLTVGESKKAAQAASTFLLLVPNHEDMAANLEYYTQVKNVLIKCVGVMWYIVGNLDASPD